MRIQKRKIILPVMVLLLGMTALGAVLYGVGNIQQNNSRKMANLNAMVYSERVKSDIMQEVGVTKALKQLLVSENGRINKFFLPSHHIRLLSGHLEISFSLESAR